MTITVDVEHNDTQQTTDAGELNTNAAAGRLFPINSSSRKRLELS